MTTFREIRIFDVISEVHSIIGRNRFDRFFIPGPLTVIDINGPYSNWNSGYVEIDLLVKSFDTPETWVKVMASDEVHIIVTR